MAERFGLTLAAEHLASEDRLRVHAETLRRWMLSEGLWSRERQRRPHRQRRERKEHFGELVQMDGSFHRWLEERGPGSAPGPSKEQEQKEPKTKKGTLLTR